MLAFHNEHIASCAFLTYFSPESSTTAANSPTSATQTTLYNDKQSITG
ncbi:maker727, partial [Drosophila busckii]